MGNYMNRRIFGVICLAAVLLGFTGCKTIDRVKKNETLYFVGGFSNWTFEPMRRDANNPYRFKLGRVMTWKGDGNFKFGTKINNWENQFHPFVAKAPFSYHLVIRDSGDNNTWLLHEEECGRAYKMSIDTGKWPMDFVMFPFEAYPAVYIAGGAAGGPQMNPDFVMEKVDDNPYMLRWYGKLKSGKFSFLCEGYSGGEGPWFEPWKDNLEPDGLEQQVDLSDTGSGRGWVIDREGNYLVVFDQLQEYALVIRDGD